MKLLLLLLALGQTPDSSSIQRARLDSLYRVRDTTGLVAALRAWNGESSARIELYRGVSAVWTGRVTQAIGILRPLLDSARGSLTRAEERAAISALAESYARKRQYADATALYDSELRSVDVTLDSTRAAEKAKADSGVAKPILDALTSPEKAPAEPAKVPGQISFIGLLVSLFLLPKMLQRFRIPGAITALLMGFAVSLIGWFPNDVTIRLFSTLGIVSLFLFAGLEIDGRELRRNVRPLILYGAIWTVLALVTGFAVARLLDLEARPAALLSLALVTPSTGFILSTLSTFGLTELEQKTVRAYAIGSELIALTALFFILQSTSARQLLIAIAAMTAVVIVIPMAFRTFAAVIAPYAPRSEFAFLLLVGIVCAYATLLLGVYYLVGAFLVGVAAQRFRAKHPAMSSERMVDALEAFGSVFIPFYFFHAGTEILAEHLSWSALGIGVMLVAVFVPLRIAVIAVHRKIALRESFAVSRRVGSAMVPTLVFTLVILGILVERFDLPYALAGALVFYTVVNTTLPGFVLHAQPVDFEDVEALPADTSAEPQLP
ncbi:MAG TPA: cation:proton antiporter [Gemmatimonadaceae bacterium]|nr:cation:proton antiporter [Gemmatimonadaceae bacterium]